MQSTTTQHANNDLRRTRAGPSPVSRKKISNQGRRVCQSEDKSGGHPHLPAPTVGVKEVYGHESGKNDASSQVDQVVSDRVFHCVS